MTKSIYLLLLLSLTSCTIIKPIPQPEREFRGFWIATVVNIDWPKNGNDQVEKQKSDYLKILEFYKSLNFNAAIVQVRTAGDAFYESDYAPWSRFLTGKEGNAPTTKENMLQWMVDQTHARGMEFHAWLNPYRATFDLNTELLSPTHDFNRHPEWMVKYGKKYYYNPGIPEVRQHMVSIIDEIVTNYDIDAVHFDDYFYPYTIKNEVFEDSLTYYNCGLRDQSLNDWRRSNMDSLIKNSHQIIKSKKPWVQFGVSPFGVWKNKATDPMGSDTQAGQTTYENLYADPLLWMEKGWLDYLVPQVYWSMDLSVASHRKIVDWWARHSSNTNLYIGNGPYKIRNNSDTAWDNKKELPDQLRLARETVAVQGNVFFSAKSLMSKNQDVVKYLKRKYYKHQILPPSQFKTAVEKSEPKLESVSAKKDHTTLYFNTLESMRFATLFSSGKKVKETYPVKKLITKVFINEGNHIVIDDHFIKGKKHIAIVLIDKFGRKSEPKIIHLNQNDTKK